MKLIAILCLIALPTFAFSQKKDTKLYELRVYYCHPGRLDALIERFTNHTVKLFEKHGMNNVGYWLPTNNTENALYYVLSFPDREAREKSWTGFNNDTAWHAVRNKSEESGKIVIKVVSTFMNAADVSPAIKGSVAKKDRSFELRTYTPAPGRLDELLSRFRNHSIALLKKHGASHIAYWTTVPQPDAPAKLIYMLAFPTQEAGNKTWVDFRADPDWIKAKAESEKDHPIVDKVESIFLTPVPFSKIK